MKVHVYDSENKKNTEEMLINNSSPESIAQTLLPEADKEEEDGPEMEID